LWTCTENLDPAEDDDDQGVLEGGKGASVNTVAEAGDTDDFVAASSAPRPSST